MGRKTLIGSGAILREFWDRVAERDDGCWEWQANRTGTGYGRVNFGGLLRPYTAHRLAWELSNAAPIPRGLYACHHCDNPPCVNPDHIFLGTQLDNQRDMSAKGRGRKSKYPPRTPSTVSGRPQTRICTVSPELASLLHEIFGSSGHAYKHIGLGMSYSVFRRAWDAKQVTPQIVETLEGNWREFSARLVRRIQEAA